MRNCKIEGGRGVLCEVQLPHQFLHLPCVNDAKQFGAISLAIRLATSRLRAAAGRIFLSVPVLRVHAEGPLHRRIAYVYWPSSYSAPSLGVAVGIVLSCFGAGFWRRKSFPQVAEIVPATIATFCSPFWGTATCDS